MNYKLGFGMMRLPVQDDGAIDYRQSCAMVDEYLSGTVATNLSLRRSCRRFSWIRRKKFARPSTNS